MVGRSLGWGLATFGLVLWIIGWVLTVGDVEAVWSYVRGMPGAGLPEFLIGAAIGLWVLMPMGTILMVVGAALFYKVGKK